MGEKAKMKRSLQDAISKGDEPRVRELLAKGVDPNQTCFYKKGYWPLLEALNADDLKGREKGVSLRIAQMLVNHGANINATSAEGKNLLFFCIERANMEFLNFVLCCGGNVNASDKNRFRPLHWAVLNAARNEVDFVKKLLDYGAKVNVKCQSGKTPLHLLAELQPSEEVSGQSLSTLTDTKISLIGQLLISSRADVNIQDNMNQTVLFSSVKCQNRVLFNLLMESNLRLNLNSPNITGITPLHLAAKHKPCEHYLKPLLEKWADVDVACRKNGTPLHFAVNEGLKENVQLLLEYCPNFKLNQYQNVVSIAMKKLSSSNYKIALLDACRSRVHSSLSSGLLHDLFLVNIEETFPFKRISENSAKNFSEISSKFEVDIVISKVEPTINLRDIILLLLKNMIPRGIGLLMYICIIRGETEILELLLGSGSKFNLNSVVSGRPLIHSAAHSSDTRAIKLLWRCGVDLNNKDEFGNTPLHSVCQVKLDTSIKELLSLGADIHSKNNDGLMPIDEALCFPWTEHYDFKKFLKDHFLFLFALGNYENISSFSSDEDSLPMLSKLFAEIEVMKKIVIPNTRISFFDFIGISEQRISVFFKNPDLLNDLKSVECETLFPIYGSIIKSKIYRAQMRRTFTDEVIKHILPEMGFISYFPGHVTDKILSFLSIEELGILNGFHGPRQN